MHPPVRIRRRVAVRVRLVPLAEWVVAENRKGHACQCGCGERIRVLPQHRAQSVPRYLRTHHPMAMPKEVIAIVRRGS